MLGPRLAIAAAAVLAATAGGTLPTTAPAARLATAAAAATTGTGAARRLEHALVAQGGPPRPTSATCRAATAPERARAPFGTTRRPLFACTIAVSGERARYIVQVLRNGCYVAERVRPGRAVLGCGAGPA